MSASLDDCSILTPSSPSHFTSLPLDTVQYYLLPFLQDSEIAFLAVTNKWYRHILVLVVGDKQDLEDTCFADCLWKRLVTQRWKSLTFPQHLEMCSSTTVELDDTRSSKTSAWYMEYSYRAKQDCRTLDLVKDLLSRVQHKSKHDMEHIWCDLLCQGNDAKDVLRSLSGPIQRRERVYDDPTVESMAEEVWMGIHRFSICKQIQYVCAYRGGHVQSSTRNGEDPPFLSLEDGALLISHFFQNADKLKAEYDNDFSLTQFVDQELTQLAESLILRLNKNDETGSYSILDVFKEMQTFFQPPTNENVSDDESNDIKPFRGNQQDYYNYKNSLLDEVIRSRRGIPISLSVIYAGIVQRAIGLQLEPVGLPGHFLLSTTLSHKDKPKERIFIDAYHGGKILNQMECAYIVNQYGIPWNVSFRLPFINFNLYIHRGSNEILG